MSSAEAWLAACENRSTLPRPVNHKTRIVMRKTVAMVFAGGRAEEMSVLTYRRPKAAVVFGGFVPNDRFCADDLANAEAIENIDLLRSSVPRR